MKFTTIPFSQCKEMYVKNDEKVKEITISLIDFQFGRVSLTQNLFKIKNKKKCLSITLYWIFVLLFILIYYTKFGSVIFF